jgi:hypothetical protein
MTANMTAISVIGGGNDCYSVLGPIVILDKPFIAKEPLLAKGFFLIQLPMWKFINQGNCCGSPMSSSADWAGPVSR